MIESEGEVNSGCRSTRRDPPVIAFAFDHRTQSSAVWQRVRGPRCRNLKFQRESPLSPYTVDLGCVALKVVVEVEGEHHQTDGGKVYDKVGD
ncbi:hypothetical protein CA13_62110 [Planctomycetes bacterium CA13]|uniref:DUF559 domain-containing protein n=1 Tax=Novipirellula herctigrandis TaxID=2527986 RepID=A0A5C5ZD40_9BACT|nr:hypothetical protein CA13_62110 [Planctomycetes bacterium CA13]